LSRPRASMIRTSKAGRSHWRVDDRCSCHRATSSHFGSRARADSNALSAGPIPARSAGSAAARGSTAGSPPTSRAASCAASVRPSVRSAVAPFRSVSLATARKQDGARLFADTSVVDINTREEEKGEKDKKISAEKRSRTIVRSVRRSSWLRASRSRLTSTSPRAAVTSRERVSVRAPRVVSCLCPRRRRRRRDPLPVRAAKPAARPPATLPYPRSVTSPGRCLRERCPPEECQIGRDSPGRSADRQRGASRSTSEREAVEREEKRRRGEKRRKERKNTNVTERVLSWGFSLARR